MSDLHGVNREWRISPLALWGPALGIFALACYFFMSFTLDDPFITFRYADNLVRGHGLVFNPGERVEGYSNPLWLLIMAGLVRLGPMFSPASTFGLILASKLLGALCAVACIWFTVRISRQLAPDSEDGSDDLAWARAIPALFLGLGIYFPMWAVSGLETSFYALLLLVCGDQYLRALLGSNRALVLAVLAAWAVGLTRPEGFFVLGAFAVHSVLWGGGLGRKRCLAWLAALAFAAAALTIFRLAYYGAWLPNTFFAKVNRPSAWSLEAGLAQAVAGLALTFGLPLPLFVLVAWPGLQFKHGWKLVILLPLFGIAFIVMSQGDWMPGYRFLAPFLPWLGLLLEGSLRVLARRSRSSLPAGGGKRTRTWVSLALGIALFVIGSAIARCQINTFREGHPFRPLHKSGSLIPASYLEAARWIRGHLPADAVLAMGEAGIIPYFVPQNVLDLLALNDAHLAHASKDFGADYVQYVLSRSPEYVLFSGITRQQADYRSRYVYGEALLRDARFVASYAPCRTFGAPPETFDGTGQNFLLYARRGCPCDSVPSPTSD